MHIFMGVLAPHDRGFSPEDSEFSPSHDEKGHDDGATYCVGIPRRISLGGLIGTNMHRDIRTSQVASSLPLLSHTECLLQKGCKETYPFQMQGQQPVV